MDEVGNADLHSSDDPNHRFLSLAGVVIGLCHVESVVHPQMEGLKSTFFGSHPDDPVILHRKELVNCRGPDTSGCTIGHCAGHRVYRHERGRDE